MSMHISSLLAVAPSDGWLSRVLQVYTPRRACMLYEQDVVWTHVFADGLIAISYFSIPFALVYFVRRRRDIGFNSVFWLFAAFIFACGMTHVFGIIDIWKPYYRLDGWVKAITGVISFFTAVMLWRLMPQMLSLPSPAQLRGINTQLTSSNDELQTMHTQLEKRVAERTAELSQRNDELAREVEARLAAEANERRLREEAERLNRMKDLFLSTLSHELRTPLNAIMGWSQILTGPYASNDKSEIREAAETILRNARVQAQLVDDLLDISRIITGRLKIAPAATSMGTVVDEAISTLKPAAEARGITIEVNAIDDADTLQIWADPQRMQQVVWNLLSNAIKFTAPNGHVTVSMAVNGQTLELSVSDDGAGIPSDFRNRLFAPFEQLDASTTRREGGLGLGLSIVRHLVELHGGHVQAQSDGVGRGSAFVVSLPIRTTPMTPADGVPAPETQTPEPARSPAAVDTRLTALNILVVEDEADARRMVAHVLRKEGAMVHTCSSADEAILLLRESLMAGGLPYHLLVSDIGMPGMDGNELIRHWRQEQRAANAPHLPALALTAYARDEERGHALSAGFDDHAAKPFDNELLVQKLLKLSGRDVTDDQ